MTHPFTILTKPHKNSVPIITVGEKHYGAWLKKQPAQIRNWLDANGFSGGACKHALLPGDNGIDAVLYVMPDAPDTWSLAALATALPASNYHLEEHFPAELATQMTLGWAVASYQFTRYRKGGRQYPVLNAPKNADMEYVESMHAAICWARDMINTPAADMHPRALADEAAAWAKAVGASITVLKGEELLKANYPTIYTVGKAATIPAHLVDIRIGKKTAPKVTLVGKGVTFDTGGLDLKSSSNMRMMKKDMAGVACALALAKVIVDTKLPVQLRLLLPIAENAVSGNAMRPLDIVKTRKGLTVEIGNTDAEGRLLICDALYEADGEKPDLLVDFTTLTGAARVAIGTEIAAFFTPDDKLATQVMKAGEKQADPLWRLPLWKPYRAMLDTPNADISNDPDSGYGGAITAALFLQEFVSRTPSWLHIDMMSWNMAARPGRPKGAEAMTVRALYALIKERYGK